jgi:hypothetical protein
LERTHIFGGIAAHKDFADFTATEGSYDQLSRVCVSKLEGDK